MTATRATRQFAGAFALAAALASPAAAQPEITNVVDANTGQVLSHDGGRTWLDGGGSGGGWGFGRSSGPSAEQLAREREERLAAEEQEQADEKVRHGEYFEAVHLYYSVLQRRPGDQEVTRRLAAAENAQALVFQTKGMWTEAGIYFDEACAHNPDNADFAYNRAEAARQARDYYDQKSDAAAERRIGNDVKVLVDELGEISGRSIMIGGGTVHFLSTANAAKGLAALRESAGQRDDDDEEDRAAATATVGFDRRGPRGEIPDVTLHGLPKLEPPVAIPEDLTGDRDIVPLRQQRDAALAEVVVVQRQLASVQERQQQAGDSDAAGEFKERASALANLLQHAQDQAASVNDSLKAVISRKHFHVDKLPEEPAS